VGFEYPSFRRIEPTGEHGALAAAIRRAIEEKKLTHIPQLRSALAKVEKAAAAKVDT
jgi:hypothetical protein